MKRILSGACLAAAFGLATLAAQTTTTTPEQRRSSTDASMHDVTVTGCLAREAGGSYALTNAHVDTGASSTTTAAGTTTTAGAATGTGGTMPPRSATTAASGNMDHAMTWMLSGDNELDKHVGHKIQVTGKTSWDMNHGSTSTTSPAGVGTTAAPPSNPTTTTGTTGSTTESRSGKSAEQPRLEVQTLKMISSSCS